MRSWIARRTLRAFAKRYGYDVSYLEMMLNIPLPPSSSSRPS